MPEPAINLQRNLIGWYEFATDYYNEETRRVTDHSGYGRSARANGGLTVGNDAPDGFESAALDATDDYFTAPQFNWNRGTEDGVTALTLVYPDPDDTAWGPSSKSRRDVYNDGTVVHDVKNGSGVSAFIIDDTGSGYSVGDVNDNQFDIDNEEWNWTGLRHTGSELQLLEELEVKDSLDTGNITIQTPSNQMHIGAEPGPDDEFGGRIAVSAFWSRSLTDVELRYLFDITATPRATL